MREVAYFHIQRKISTRQLRAGSPVSDVAIANELGISRTPAREATRQLVAEGLLEAVPGRGLVVVTLDRGDIDDLYEMREALEVKAVKNVALHLAGTAEIKNLRKVAQKMSGLIEELEKTPNAVLDENQMARFEVADLAFHTYLMTIAGNQRSLKMVSGIRLLMRIFAARRSGHDLVALRRIYKDHLDVIEGIEAGDAERAAGVLSNHINNSWRDRLEQFNRREREASLPHNIDAFLEAIQADIR
jgi:DNA-binding GntR family transcriptional regulator